MMRISSCFLLIRVYKIFYKWWEKSSSSFKVTAQQVIRKDEIWNHRCLTPKFLPSCHPVYIVLISLPGKCPCLYLTKTTFPGPSQVLSPSESLFDSPIQMWCLPQNPHSNVSLIHTQHCAPVTYVLPHEVLDTRVRVASETEPFAPSLCPVSSEAEHFAPNRYLIKSVELNRGSLRSQMENSVQFNPGIIYLLDRKSVV